MSGSAAPAWLDGWRLSVGTLTSLPVRPPSQVDRPRAAVAMVLAPLAALVLAVPAATIAWAGERLGSPPLVLALLVVAVLALGNRGMHLDGLADTADALAAPRDADGKLAVMVSGDVGPVGAAVLVLVLGAQAAAFAALLGMTHGWIAVLVVVCASRASLVLVCLRGVPPARDAGLGAAVAGVVPRSAAIASWVVVGAALVAVDPSAWVQPVLATVAAAVGVALLVRRSVRAFGGTTGDVCGASIECALTVLLVALVL